MRSDSRLMVMDRRGGEMAHVRFHDLPQFLTAGDLLVANDSRVIPARLFGVKEPTGGAVELLLLRPLAQAGVWETLARPGRRLRVGHAISFGAGQLHAQVVGMGQGGTRLVRFSAHGTSFERLLDQLGEMPLPPYIREALSDPERYQTVYAKAKGSVAAPTAGLHFTPELLDVLRERGINTAFITLHVGLGTFRPVQSASIEEHHMHEEWYQVEPSVVRSILETRQAGRRLVCVGTTTVRALESAWLDAERRGDRLDLTRLPDAPLCGWTNIFIYPGVPLRVTDALITNFHLPKSTLLMLVSTLAGRERLLQAYETAVQQQYRFFSFGDAMLIL